MAQHYYDSIILGGGSAGLFASIFLPGNKISHRSGPPSFKQRGNSICIIDRADKLWTKLLLSWWERCNVTNSDLHPTRDYIGENIKALPSIFHVFNNHDMIDFLASHGIETIVEDRGRVLLKSGKAKQLRDLLVQLSAERGTDVFLGQSVVKVEHTDWIFTITTDKEIFQAKNLIVATGGKSYPQVGATAIGYELAEQFGVRFVAPRPALCGMETMENVAELAGSPAQWRLRLLDGKKVLYDAFWPLLFTHWWLSGPVVFDVSLRAANALRDTEKSLTIHLDFDLEHTSKKILRFFPSLAKDSKLSFALKCLRPWEEAKVSVWWVSLKELDPYFQVKSFPGLYFIGEILDVTGRSWWYNLQWAWSSAYLCSKGMNN